MYINHSKVAPSLLTSLKELEAFIKASTSGSFLQHQAFLSKTLKDVKENDLIMMFYLQDQVTVVSSLFIMMTGKIVQVLDDNKVSVVLDNPEGANISAQIPIKDLRRTFKIGDNMRVWQDLEKGRQGVVMRIDGTILVFTDPNTHHNDIEEISSNTQPPLTSIEVSSLIYPVI